jgi:hypothetical protein
MIVDARERLSASRTGEAALRRVRAEIARLGGAEERVVRTSGGGWMHHLEVRRVADVDAEVRGWIARAYREGA